VVDASRVSEKLKRFGTTIFAEMTRLALEHRAINLSQGFPDFEGPPEIVEAVAAAMREGHNQYARSMGRPELVTAIAAIQRDRFGLSYEPMSEIAVTSGATEAIASSLIGLLNPGDEVLLFEPFYDSYPVNTAMVGAAARFVTLRFPDFALDEAALLGAITGRTRVIVLNTPNNPTGKVFTIPELEVIARVCRERDLVVISDEVYEHLTYDGTPHVTIATLPGMRERTLRISSAGKSYSFTGWKIGWAMGPQPLIQAMQAAHQFITFATATPIQVGLGRAMSALPMSYYDELRADYQARRDFLTGVLEEVGFEVARPRGTYFVLAKFGALFDGDDRAFAQHLVEKVGVAAIPPTPFYEADREEGKSLVRFAFCKRRQTLEAAAERLLTLKRG
jgi:N-succinyldiaminopimelate aminotransferase